MEACVNRRRTAKNAPFRDVPEHARAESGHDQVVDVQGQFFDP
jgi:hypothetical protein